MVTLGIGPIVFESPNKAACRPAVTTACPASRSTRCSACSTGPFSVRSALPLRALLAANPPVSRRRIVISPFGVSCKGSVKIPSACASSAPRCCAISSWPMRSPAPCRYRGRAVDADRRVCRPRRIDPHDLDRRAGDVDPGGTGRSLRRPDRRARLHARPPVRPAVESFLLDVPDRRASDLHRAVSRGGFSACSAACPPCRARTTTDDRVCPGGRRAAEVVWCAAGDRQRHASLPSGARTALIGPNGAGKSTLVGFLSGTIRPNEGRMSLDGRDVTRVSSASRVPRGLVRTFQVSSLFRQAHVARERLSGGQRASDGERRHVATGPPATRADRSMRKPSSNAFALPTFGTTSLESSVRRAATARYRRRACRRAQGAAARRTCRRHSRASRSRACLESAETLPCRPLHPDDRARHHVVRRFATEVNVVVQGRSLMEAAADVMARRRARCVSGRSGQSRSPAERCLNRSISPAAGGDHDRRALQLVDSRRRDGLDRRPQRRRQVHPARGHCRTRPAPFRRDPLRRP